MPALLADGFASCPHARSPLPLPNNHIRNWKPITPNQHQTERIFVCYLCNLKFIFSLIYLWIMLNYMKTLWSKPALLGDFNSREYWILLKRSGQCLSNKAQAHCRFTEHVQGRLHLNYTNQYRLHKIKINYCQCNLQQF